MIVVDLPYCPRCRAWHVNGCPPPDDYTRRQEIADIDARIGELMARRAHLIRAGVAAGEFREQGVIEHHGPQAHPTP